MKNSKKLVFIGGNRYGEDGPLICFMKASQKKGFKSILITDEEHIKYKCANSNSFQHELVKNDINFIVVENLQGIKVKNLFTEDVLVFSVNCHWIIKKDLIDLVRGKIFNYHAASIPEQKGAASHSWGLMQGIRNFRLTYHHLTEQVDEGDIVFERELKPTKNFKSLEEIYSFISKHEVEAFDNFLNLVENTYPNIPIINISDRKKFYWPKLKTDLNGFIDWTWSVQEIVNFCYAFDNPFGGASTYLDQKRVRLKQVEIDDEDVKFHPFQYGLIYRISNNHVWIAAKGGGLKVGQILKPNLSVIRLGKRFVTDHSVLINAKNNLIIQ